RRRHAPHRALLRGARPPARPRPPRGRPPPLRPGGRGSPRRPDPGARPARPHAGAAARLDGRRGRPGRPARALARPGRAGIRGPRPDPGRVPAPRRDAGLAGARPPGGAGAARGRAAREAAADPDAARRVRGAGVNPQTPPSPRYKWVALSNTTLGILMATINSSIVLIALPDIFRGIHLNPLGAGNSSYLLCMIMGFLVATAVLVVSFGRV